jgi:rubredoxin
VQTLANIERRSSGISFVNPSRLYFVTKNQFLLQRLTEFVSYKYNFYTGELVIDLDRANIIQGMKRLQAYKYELMPNGDQVRDMRRFSGSCRFVYNQALALQKENHEAGTKFIGYVAMAAKLPVWCPACGNVSKNNRQAQAKFLCVDCDYENHADVVGAINVLERGYRLLARRESVQSGHSMKQEPTEVTQAAFA